MKEAGELRVREIQGDAWRQKRAIVPRGEPLALGELLDLAAGGRLFSEASGEAGAGRVVHLDTSSGQRSFLVPDSVLPLLGLYDDTDPARLP